MATEVAALVARLEADTRKFDKGMKSAEKRLKGFDKEGGKTRKSLGKTDSAMGNLTNTVKGFAAAAGVAFATKAVVNFAKSAVTAASDLGESINAVEVVFEDAAEGIKSLGVEAADAVGLSNAEFNTLAVGFAAFVEKIDAGGDDVVGVMKELTGRAADFASVMNIDVAEAATIFRSGLAGETEPLRKFGIDLAAVTVTQRALALGLAETSSQLTEQDKIIARYDLLMEQTKKTQGDFANTSDQLANATRRLTSQWENAKAVIGEALIPTIEDLFPLLEKGVDIVIDLAIEFGVLTGSITEVDAAIRKAKLGLEEGATATDFLFASVEKLREEARPGMFDSMILAVKQAINPVQGLIDTFKVMRDVITSSVTKSIDQLLESTDNLAETFSFTADDADSLRRNAEELADEWGTTEAAVLLLADRLDIDLVKAMQNISAKEGIALLENTQDIRDAVLDGTDAVLDHGSALQILEGQQKDLADAMDDARGTVRDLIQAQKDLRTEYMEAADPIFALAKSIDRAAEAEEIYNEFVAEGTQLTREGIDAWFDSAAAIAEVDASARALNDAGVLEGIRRLGDLTGKTDDEVRLLLESYGILDAVRIDTEVGFQFNLTPADRALFNFLQGGSTRTGGGFNISVSPSDRKFFTAHSGAVVPGVPGTDVPAILQPGETVRTVQQERALQAGTPGGSGFFGGPGSGLFGGDVPGSISRSITAVANAVDHLFAATVSVFARAVSEFVDGLDRLTVSVSTVSTVIRQSNTVLDKEAVALDELSAVTKDLQDVFGPGGFGSGAPGGFGPSPRSGLPGGGFGPRSRFGPGFGGDRFGPGFGSELGVDVPGSLPGSGLPGGGFGRPSGGPGADGGSGGSGEPGTTIIVQGFVGSELQLAAQIDKLLTRRSKTSKLGF